MLTTKKKQFPHCNCLNFSESKGGKKREREKTKKKKKKTENIELLRSVVCVYPYVCFNVSSIDKVYKTAAIKKKKKNW